MTKVFGLVAWLAVAIIAIFGIARGQDTDTLVLLCISTAIAVHPHRPADVRADDARRRALVGWPSRKQS